MVKVSDYVDYSVPFNDHKDVVYPGKSDEQFLSLFGSKSVNLYIHRCSESQQNNLNINFVVEYSDDLIETYQNEIEEKFSNI